jgi:hypothetical protein
MSQYPGGQPPQDPYYYGQPPQDPYGPPPQQPSDPYFGQGPGDPYAQQQQQPEWWYAQQQAEAYAQQQAWYAQQQAAQAQEVRRRPQHQGGTGAAIVGIFLVLLGVWFLFRDEIAIDLATVWPIVAVGLGVIMVLGAFIPRRG